MFWLFLCPFVSHYVLRQTKLHVMAFSRLEYVFCRVVLAVGEGGGSEAGLVFRLLEQASLRQFFEKYVYQVQ